MKKKLLLVALFSMLLCLTACSKEVILPADFDANMYGNAVLQMTDYAVQMDSQALTVFANDAEDYVTAEELGYEVDVYKELCSGTLVAREEAGQAVSMSGEVQFSVSGIEKNIVTITIPVQYEKYIVNYEYTLVPNPKAEYNPEELKYNLTQVVVASQKSMGELMKEAGLNTIMGMGVVFLALIFISFVIALFKYLPCSGAKELKKKEAEKKVAAEKTADKVVAPVTTTEASENLMDNKELVAVITAAVMAASGSTSAITSSDTLIVRSIKRVSR